MAERFDLEAIQRLTEQAAERFSPAHLLRMAATLLDEGEPRLARSLAERAILALPVDEVSRG